MDKVLIRPASEIDARYIARNLRLSDKEEMLAQHGLFCDLESHLELCYGEAEEANVAELNGVPFCIYGVNKLAFGREMRAGSPWLVATDDFDKAPLKKVYTESVSYIRYLKANYDYLANYVHYKNSVSIEWLRRIGFSVYEHRPIKYGVYGETFYLFDSL